MAKPKSLKLRVFATLQTLIKYSDVNHRMNMKKINEYLRPYGEEYHRSASYADTVKVLQAFGYDIRRATDYDKHGFWFHESPLTDTGLKRIILAVSTCPYLTQQQATETLQCLKPFVSVYQEPLLESRVNSEWGTDYNDSLWQTYSVIQTAILEKKCVRYVRSILKHEKDTGFLKEAPGYSNLFAPKAVHQAKDSLYVEGYNFTKRCAETVDLNEITAVRIANEKRLANDEIVKQVFNSLDSKKNITNMEDLVIYEGPIEFCCSAKYIPIVFKRFGPPAGPVLKSNKRMVTYPIAGSKISTNDLYWLSQIPKHLIRIKGPAKLSKTVQQYYQETCDVLLNPVLRV